MKKEELMCHCRDVNDINDCGMCQYEFTDTCRLRLRNLKKKKLLGMEDRNERKVIIEDNFNEKEETEKEKIKKE